MKQALGIASVAVLLGALMLVAAPWSVAGEDQAKAPAPVPRTGQVKSYAKGDDGAYQAGVPWPDPRFTLEGDCVTDNLTGLIWAKNVNIAGKNMPWADALVFCNDLELGGCKDWRLPNAKEMQTLDDWSQEGGSASRLPKGHPFTGTPAMCTWSSTTFVGNTEAAWMSRSDGYFGHLGKADACGVWPVRGGVLKDAAPVKAIALVARTGQTKSYAPGDDGDVQAGVAWPNPRFTVDGDRVIDSLTGLMWAKNADIAGTTMSGYEAMTFCAKQELGGHKDWRLPNVKEMQSLVDFSSGLIATPFENVPAPASNATYASGTIGMPLYGKLSTDLYWTMNSQGYWAPIGPDGSRYKQRAWPVRGGVLAPPKAADPQTPEKK